MTDSKSTKADLIDRSDKSPSPAGNATLIGLRAADPLLQWAILARGYGSHMIYHLGGHTVPHGTHVEALELSPYRLILLSMAVGTSLKHIFWTTSIRETTMPLGGAVFVGLYNTTLNSLNNLLFTCTVTTAVLGEDHTEHGFPSVPLVVGTIAFVVGITTETWAEIQRKNFKKDSRNRNKAYSGGLFSFARHINYAGYTLWRFGMATASAGFIWGGVTAAWHLVNFSMISVPALDEYCQKRVCLSPV